MRQGRLGAEHVLLEVVERRQANGEELAEDDAFRDAVSDPEAELRRQAAQAAVELLLVARGDVGHAIAHDHPVEDRIVGLAPLPPGVADRRGILRQLEDLVAHRVDTRQHVEIDEGVVHRRHQRIGDAMGDPVQERIGARRVDDDEVVRVLDVGQTVGELTELLALIVRDRLAAGRRNVEMLRDREGKTRHARPAAAVFDVARQRKLATVKINRRNGIARAKQRNGDMHGGRGFSRTTFFVSADYYVGGLSLLPVWKAAATR